MKKHKTVVFIGMFLIMAVNNLHLNLHAQNGNLIAESIKDEFQKARAVHFSVSQQECISMFNSIIEEINENYDKISEEEKGSIFSALLDSHMYIGITYFNAGQIENANIEFKKIIMINPDYNPDSSLISNTIINAFNKVRDENTAVLNVNTRPEGAEVYIGQQALGTTPIKDKRLNYGKYEFRIHKPNYAEISKEIDLYRDQSISENLERIYASLEVTTSPPYVDIYIEGEYMGSTSSDIYPLTDKHIYRETDILSDPFIINQVPQKTVSITFSQSCYKTVTRNIIIESNDDFTLDTVFMEPNTASIELVGETEGSRIFINDQLYGMGKNIIENICFGDHIIKVINPRGGVWTKRFRVDSNRRIFEEVVFKPSILWLGLYDINAEYYTNPGIDEFNRLLERLKNYNVIFDSISGDNRYSGLFRASLTGEYPPEFTAGMSELHHKYNFDIIAFGILDPLSIDREFDIYFYHYSHDKPYVEKLSTKETAFLYNFIISLDSDIGFTEKWLGFDIISNPSEESGLVVIRIYPNSPASSVDIELYDRIIALDGLEINTAADFREYLSALSADNKLMLKIQRQSRIIETEIQVSVLPKEYGYLRNYNYNLILANLYFLLSSEKLPFYKDIYYLNTGLCYMHFGLYEKALKSGFSMISDYSNLGIMYGSPELYSGICYYNIGAIDRAKALFSSAVLRKDSVLGDFPYYSVSNIAHFYLFLVGAIQ